MSEVAHRSGTDSKQLTSIGEILLAAGDLADYLEAAGRNALNGARDVERYMRCRSSRLNVIYYLPKIIQTFCAEHDHHILEPGVAAVIDGYAQLAREALDDEESVMGIPLCGPGNRIGEPNDFTKLGLRLFVEQNVTD